MYLQCVYYLIGKDYPIQASTKDEMIVWIKAIEDAAVSYHTHMYINQKFLKKKDSSCIVNFLYQLIKSKELCNIRER